MQHLTWQELKTLQVETNDDARRTAIAERAEFIPAYRVMSLEPKQRCINGAMYVVPGATEWVEWGDRTFYNRLVAEEQYRYDKAHGKTVMIKEVEIPLHYAETC